ncbi:MAG: hypothetical protein RSC69_02020, partial [Lachnospiraceae bacterium]
MKKKLKRVLAVCLCALMVLPTLIGNGMLVQADEGTPATPAEGVTEEVMGAVPSGVDVTTPGCAVLSFTNDLAQSVTIEAGAIAASGMEKVFDASIELVLNDTIIGEKIEAGTLENHNYTYTTKFTSTSTLSVNNSQKGDLRLPAPNNAVIGSYEATVIASNQVTLKFTIIGSEIANLTGVIAGCKVTMQLSQNAETATIPDLSGAATNDITFTYKEKQPEPAKPDYTLTKTGVQAGNQVTYTITARVAGGEPLDPPSLKGCYLYDQLPDNIIFQGGTVSFYDKDKKEVGTATSVTESTTGTGIFNIQIPDVPATPVTEAVLTVSAAISKSAYEAYMSSNTNLGIIVDNTAYLYDGDITAESPLTPVQVLKNANCRTSFFSNTAFLSKDGHQIGNSGQSMEWILKGEAYFSSGTDVYVVDYIEDKSKHQYNTTQNLTIHYSSGTDDTATITDLGDKSADDTFKGYSELVLSDITAQGITVPTCYTKGSGQVLIIPLDGNALNGPFSITYQTDIQGITEDTSGTIALTNEAKMIWSSLSYGGEGIAFTDIGFGKITKAPNFSAICMRPNNNYNPITQSCGWTISVNECGQVFGTSSENTIIEEDLTGEGLAYVGAAQQAASSESITIIAKTINSSATGQESLTRKDTAAEVKRTPMTYSITDGDTKLTVNLGHLDGKINYWIPIETKISNPNFLAVEQSGAVIESEAVLSYGTQTRRSKAQQPYSNNWCDKDAVSNYNYKTHGVSWKVTVNPYKLKVKDAELTDVLPEETEFAVLKNVKYNDAELTIESGNTTIPVTTAGSGTIHFKDPADIELQWNVEEKNGAFQLITKILSKPGTTNEIQAKVELFYDTIYKESYRTTKEWIENGHVSKNTVTLTGTHEGSQITASNGVPLTIDAVRNFKLSPIMKTAGVSTKDREGFIQIPWTVELNRDGTDFTNKQIKDVLEQNLELVLDENAPYDKTLQIVPASVAEDGTLTAKGSVLPIAAFSPETTERGFTITVPEQYKTEPLILTFFTRLIEIKGSGDQRITNTIALHSNIGSLPTNEDAKEETIINNRLDSDGYAKGTALKYIEADSFFTEDPSNLTLDPAKQLEKLDLILTPMDNSSGTWKVETKGKKISLSLKNDESRFLRIKENKLYRMEQGEPSVRPEYADYGLLTKPQYIIFTDNIAMTYPLDAVEGKNLQIIATREKTAKVHFFNSSKRSLKIEKTSEDDKLMGFSFVITGAKGSTVTKVTDEKGKIELNDLEPDVYTIMEVRDAASEKYLPSGVQTIDLTTIGSAVCKVFNAIDWRTLRIRK